MELDPKTQEMIEEINSDEYKEFIVDKGRVINNLPFSEWGDPKPLTKKDVDEVIDAFKRNPNMFKDLGPRWQ